MAKRPIFTKQHFEAVADWIRQTPTLSPNEKEIVADELVAMFEYHNLAFDKERFIDRIFG